MRGLSRDIRHPRGPAAVLVALMMTLVTSLSGQRPPVGAGTADRPECPHDWRKYLEGRRLITSPSGGFTLPGPITDVPEFHDCQRFILPTGGDGSYDQLYAVFVPPDLDTRFAGISTTKARALVEIYAEGTYKSLGIKPTFNCVFFYYVMLPAPVLQPLLVAKLVNTFDSDIMCDEVVDPSTLPGPPNGTDLLVTPYDPPAGLEQYPPPRWRDGIGTGT